MVPKFSSAATKLIRTTEGVLLIASNAVLVIVSVAGSLPWSTSTKYMTILTGAGFIARQVVKAVASLSPSLGAPAFPAGTPSALENEDTATQAAADLDYEQGPPEADIDPAGLVEQDGAPASSLTSAGAPSAPQQGVS